VLKRRHRLERRRLETVIRESGERLRQLAETQAILDALPAKIALIKPDGVIVAVNRLWRRAAEAHGQIDSDCGVGQNYLQVCDRVHGTAVAALREAAVDIQRVLNGELPEFFLEYQCQVRGAARWFRLILVPLRESQLAGAVAMHINMTALKQAEAVRDESQQLLNKALQVGNIGSWVYTFPKEGDKEGRVIWSAETYRIFGLALNEFDGQLETFLALVHPGDRERLVSERTKALANGTRFDYEYRIRQKIGRERWVRGAADVERDADGKPIRLTGVVQDITERKHLEEQLRHTHKMEAVGQLAGGIAHDFNNILSAILGNAELARRLPYTSPEVKRYLNNIVSASRRAADLVRQILLFSRSQPQQRFPLLLEPVIKEALTLVRASVPASIEFQVELREPRTVLVDPSEIHQVTLNLCTNAWHAMNNRPGILRVDLSDAVVDETMAQGHPELRP